MDNTIVSHRRSALRFVVVTVMVMTLLGETQAAFSSFHARVNGWRINRTTPNHPSSLFAPPTASTQLMSSTSSESMSSTVNDRSDSSPPMAVEEVTGWRGQLLKASDIASMLCVLDCTVLPIVTVVLPFFGLVAATPAQMEYLHQLGHSVALFFVLPVGGSATILNYMYAHKIPSIAALGVFGLTLVFMANAPHGLLHLVEDTIILKLLYPLLHAVHHGIAHRLTNILGCACLLGSNYLSKQSGKCLHGHDHSECSDSGHSHSHAHHDHDH